MTTLLSEGEGNFKMNGVEWILTRMVHGARPVILKAPALFRQRLIYIEPTNQENICELRIVDPLTEHRTNPIEVNGETVDQIIKTFNPQKEYVNQNEGRG